MNGFICLFDGVEPHDPGSSGISDGSFRQLPHFDISDRGEALPFLDTEVWHKYDKNCLKEFQIAKQFTKKSVFQQKGLSRSS